MRAEATGSCGIAAAVRAATLAVAVALAAASPARAADPVGVVRLADGIASIRRGDATLPARSGLPVLETDVLETGRDGRLGVILRDDTRIALGPDSTVRVDEFRFEPVEQRLGLLVRVIRGVAAFVSGHIARLAPEAVRVETPVGIVGIRGTRFATRIEAE